jgi:hypothetical protein
MKRVKSVLPSRANRIAVEQRGADERAVMEALSIGIEQQSLPPCP